MAMSVSRIPLRLFGLIGVFALLSWSANAAVLAFDQFGYEYDDSINVGQLVGEMLSVSLIDVVTGFFANPFFAFANMAMLVSVVVIAVAEVQRNADRAVGVLTVAVLSVPPGALAFVSMLSSLSVGLDGEWLGEGFPIFEALFFWSVVVCLYAAPDFLRVWGGRTSGVPLAPGEPLPPAG